MMDIKAFIIGAFIGHIIVVCLLLLIWRDWGNCNNAPVEFFFANASGDYMIWDDLHEQ